MNYMDQVAELLGVELGERFGITGEENENVVFWLSYDGLYWKEGESGDTDGCELMGLLTGERKIIKKPWKPQEGERCYCVSMTWNTVCPRTFFCDDSELLMMYAMGNCFKTKEEAEMHKAEIMAKFAEIRKELKND